VDSERVHIALQELDMDGHDADAGDPRDELKVRTARGAVRARGANQTEYLTNVRSHDLTFGIGPAGTGKTYLAVACAVEALQSELVRRIVLVRPAVEAGERLGFLPGDLSQKVDPYLRPMYDALYEMLGFERVAKLIERNVIEVAPLAFMRGRSLNDSFVILDEAQNTTNEQMKMFLTRIGFGSKAVVTGDITQVDLPNSKASGLRTVIDVLRGVRGIAFTMFSSKDVVRHPLVQRIVQAYEAKTPDDGV
jgi:phosphate starvation-inducible PhoH-like protein